MLYSGITEGYLFHFDRGQTDSLPQSPELQGRYTWREGSSWEQGTHYLTPSNSGAPVARARLARQTPAGQAWLERSGIGRSRPEIGTWVSPAAVGRCLTAYLISTSTYYTVHWGQPTKSTTVPGRQVHQVWWAEACVQLPRPFEGTFDKHDGDGYRH